jgi:hypothetical protein
MVSNASIPIHNKFSVILQSFKTIKVDGECGFSRLCNFEKMKLYLSWVLQFDDSRIKPFFEKM